MMSADTMEEIINQSAMSSSFKKVKFQGNSFKLVTWEPLPVPGPGQVLIKNAFSTINPYDRIIYGSFHTEGQWVGCDGSGTIQAVGEGVSGDLVSRKVCFLGDGWGTHCVKPANMLVFLDDSQDLIKAACGYVNPMTALGMLYYAKHKYKAKAVISTAASSQLAQMFFKLAKAEGIEVINLVRTAAHAEELKQKFGPETMVYFTEQEDFIPGVVEAIQKCQPTLIYEVLGGPFSGRVLKAMPAGSRMICMGNLTHTPVTFDSEDLHWSKKEITGLMLGSFLEELSEAERQAEFQKVAQDLKLEKPHFFESTIVKTIKLQDWEGAIAESAQVASKGKYVIDCQQ